VTGIKNLDETMFEKDQLKGLVPLLPTKEDVCGEGVVGVLVLNREFKILLGTVLRESNKLC
jgi:hypothetical protein